MNKVLIIGLDGATWDVIQPLVDEGKLPIIKKLLEEGVWGNLESTIPPITSPAWFSMATGMNPGKLGVFDFFSRKNNTYKLHSATSSDFHGKAIWDFVAGHQNKKVGIVNYPMLFPPYEINGFMISGVGSSETRDITFPKSKKKEIDDIANTYEIAVNYGDKKYDNEDLYFPDVYRVLKKRVRVISQLMREEDWELFISIFSCTDWTQHLMWKHIDESHPLYDPERSEKYKQEFVKFWMKIDEILGNIIKMAGKNTNVFLVSDHGFGPQDECFNLVKWLEEKGYLVRKSKEVSNNIMKEQIRPLLSMAGKVGLGRVLPKKIAEKISDSFTTAGIVDQIDFEKSKAFVLGHSIPFGGIYLNVKGRDPLGCINKGSEYDTLKREIISELKDLRKEVGHDIEVSIFNPDEIYKGDKVELAPDIIFTIDNWSCIVNEENIDEVLFKNEPYSNKHTGSHRLNGIFLAHGPDIRKGVRINNVKIYDIAPTILYMFDIPIPRDIDGKVHKNIFNDECEIAKREIKYQEIDDKEKVRKRIKELKNLRKL